MGVIRELDYGTVVKIAAGEVIDRPASVVREFLDNAIDAGGDSISVHLSGGGIGYIEVSDNGLGMDREDLELCYKNHTTSKIREFNDLTQLHTLGFRGEALSSIAEVSELTILSRAEGALSGYELSVRYGEFQSLNERGMARGTSAIVKNIFENLPARKKFLAAPSSELKLIDKEIVKKALAFPEVSFELVNEGKRKYLTPSRNTFFEKIADFFPDSVDHLMPVEYAGDGFIISGFVSKPDFIRPNRMYQYLLVNNRAVEWKNFFFALSNAYGNLIPRGHFPAAFIRIDCEPEIVDVNVHPMKREVRFQNDAKMGKELTRCIASTVGSSYGLTEEDSGVPQFTPFERRIGGAISEYMSHNQNVERTVFRETFSLSSPENTEKPVYPETESLFETRKTEESLLECRYAGSLFRTYLLFEKEDSVIVLDQHAAHERINYEKLRMRYRDGVFASQPLLEPQRIEVPSEIVEDMVEGLALLKAMGFETEHFGGNSFLIHSVPEYVETGEAADIVMGFVETLEEKHDASIDFVDAALKQMACKSSIRAGDAVTKEEALALVENWEQTPNRFSCPHGRPVAVTMPKLDFEKMFKRTGF